VVSLTLMEELPNLKEFEGWYNALFGTIFRHPDVPADDLIGLHPEGVAMQLLRLAYIAARHEEGAYGDPDLR